MSILHLIQRKEICTQDCVFEDLTDAYLTEYHKKSECNAMNKRSCKLTWFPHNVVQLLNYEIILNIFKNSGPEYFPKWLKSLKLEC